MALAGDTDCLIQMAESDVTKPYIQGRVKEILNSALIGTQEQTIAKLTQQIAKVKITSAQEAHKQRDRSDLMFKKLQDQVKEMDLASKTQHDREIRDKESLIKKHAMLKDDFDYQL